jgi:hypothetical protein
MGLDKVFLSRIFVVRDISNTADGATAKLPIQISVDPDSSYKITK